MKLHLTSAYPLHPGLDTLLQATANGTTGTHSVSPSASDSDAIVFIENTQFDDLLFKKLLNHEWVERFPEKCFMYNEMDRPWDVLPGLYTCMNKRHLRTPRHRAFAYLSTPNPLIRDVYRSEHQKQWLYSFMGAMSHHCRRSVMRLSDEHGYLRDTSDFNVWKSDECELQRRAEEYARVLGESHFILCPRGIGTSSIRLYETLEAGRVPVIISDDWVPPEETDWSFALRVEERHISRIPKLLESLVNEAEDRGHAARKAWLKHYAPDVLFDTLGDAIESLTSEGKGAMLQSPPIQWNKWVASSGLAARTAVQKLRGQR
ncbi:MAG: exostosin family protein [Granulosicoccus sp.]